MASLLDYPGGSSSLGTGSGERWRSLALSAGRESLGMMSPPQQLHTKDSSYLNRKSEYCFVPFSIIHLAAHENEYMHFILSLSLKP